MNKSGLRAPTMIVAAAAVMLVSQASRAAFITVTSVQSRVEVLAEYTTNNGVSWSQAYMQTYTTGTNGVQVGTSSFNNVASAGGTTSNKGFAMASWDLSDPALTSGYTGGPILVSGKGKAAGKGVRERISVLSDIQFTLNGNAVADLNLFSSLGAGQNAGGTSYSKLFYNSNPLALHEAVGNSNLTLFGISLLAGNYELKSYTFLTGQSIGLNVTNSISGQASFDLANITPVPVPEPASSAMWGLGALGMAFARRQRNRRNSTIAS